eukprot:TRINITY_DN1277_c0_g1_i4.p1 TRINITY_DN1277_c0_g1~~TRINITY_DN1277_c0_g1_i4.p1  ORF type:complete len:546 (+),score=198.50 TRINITY_DN1277_c0_g1_i4:101-1738(+)
MSVSFRSLTNGITFSQKKRKKTEMSTEAEILKDEVLPHSEPMLPVGDGSSVKALQKSLGIRVTGSDVPCPLRSWWDLSGQLPESLIECVSSRYPVPTPIQAQAIPILLKGRDLLASAPTGSGKTAAYLLPLLLHREKSKLRYLILCPTRELSHQIREEALKLLPPSYKPSSVCLASSKTPSSIKASVLISTPNTLVYLLQKIPDLLNTLEWLIVDESDKLFEDKGSRSFREQLALIYKAASSSKKAFFSATLAPDVENWCKVNLDNAVSVTVGVKNLASKDVKQRLLYTGNEKGKVYALKNLIQSGGLKPPALVFVQDHQRADELKELFVKEEDIKAEVIHSHRSLLQREEAIKSFRSGRTWVLICTELLCRGIDVKGVNLVVNYDFPPSTVSYIHRVGRTGRAGRPGEALTFFTDEDKTLLRSIAQVVSSSGSEVPQYMLGLKKASRQEKRRLASQGLSRDSIKGESKYDAKKRERLSGIIYASQKRKMKKLAVEKGESFNEDAFVARFGKAPLPKKKEDPKATTKVSTKKKKDSKPQRKNKEN